MHNRDLRILNRIKNTLHKGKIITHNNKNSSTYIVSNEIDMEYLTRKLNGLIRIKSRSLKIACTLYKIDYINPLFCIEVKDSYFSGLMDANGNIVFNFNNNKIECHLHLKHNKDGSILAFDNVIPYCKPFIYDSLFSYRALLLFKHKIFKYKSFEAMLRYYEYFKVNRLYSDFKFYRVRLIKKFIEIRDYQNYYLNTKEYIIYSYLLVK